MSNDSSNKNLDEVLDAFIMEADTGRTTLLRYLRDFPQFASDLLDLSREMTLGTHTTNEPLGSSDDLLIAAAWQQHVGLVPNTLDPLASLRPVELNQLSDAFDLPRQVFSALRDHRVIVSSISNNFLRKLAEHIGCELKCLVDSLNQPPKTAIDVSRKSEVKPIEPQKVSFEQILLDAEIDSKRLGQLISDN